MPIDYQDLHRQVRQWGDSAPEHEKNLQLRCADGFDWLKKFASEQDLLRARVDCAAQADPWLRCAVPFREPLDTHVPLPARNTPVTILAADGSQIFPNPHAQLPYGLINLGAFEICPGEPDSPHQVVKSALIPEPELITESGWISEERIAMMRDLEERRFLAVLAKQASLIEGSVPLGGGQVPLQGGLTRHPVIALTDGPLELFRESVARETPESRRLFHEYLDAMSDLGAIGAIAAGYVDKPRSDLVVRLLELAGLPEADLPRAAKMRPLLPVTDAALFGRLLAPGERSAVMAIHSHTAAQFEAADLGLYFFYLNVGWNEHPWITRTEIPAWVAEHPERVDLLHATLVEQCRALGARPYPYALHRAHEVAVVTMVEHEQVEAMLVQELYRRGVPVGQKSAKQSHKDLPGRTRI